jgi:hypothetical protein
MKQSIFTASLLLIGLAAGAFVLFTASAKPLVKSFDKGFNDEKEETVRIELGEGMLDDDREITVVGWEEVEIKASEKDKNSLGSKEEILLVEVVVFNRSEKSRSVLSVLGMHLRDAAGKKYQPLFGGGIKSSDAEDGEYEISDLGDSLADNEEWFGKIGFRVDKTATDLDAVFTFDDEVLTVDLGRAPKEVRLDKIKWEGAGEAALKGKAATKGSAANINSEPEFEFVDDNANANSAANSNNQPQFEFSDEKENAQQEIIFEMACDAPKPFNGSLCENGKWLTAEEMNQRLTKVETVLPPDEKLADQDVSGENRPPTKPALHTRSKKL